MPWGGCWSCFGGRSVREWCCAVWGAGVLLRLLCAGTGWWCGVFLPSGGPTSQVRDVGHPGRGRSGCGWGEEAGEEEVEEDLAVGGEADVRVGGAGVFAGIALVVDAEADGGGGAEGWVEEGGDDEGVVEDGGLLAPLGVEEGEVVGEGGAVAEEGGAAEFVEGEAGGVEGVEGEGDAGGEELLGAGDAVADVPLGVWRRGWGGGVGEGWAVAAVDGAAHEDDLFEEAEGGGVAVDGGLDGGEGAEGDEGDLVGVGADGVEQEGDAVGVDGGGGDALGEGALGEGGGRGGGGAGGDEDVAVAGIGEEAGKEAGAEGGVAEGGGDAEEVELGGLEEEGDGEGVVDVVADVGVEEDELGGGGGHLGSGVGVACAAGRAEGEARGTR